MCFVLTVSESLIVVSLGHFVAPIVGHNPFHGIFLLETNVDPRTIEATLPIRYENCISLSPSKSSCMLRSPFRAGKMDYWRLFGERKIGVK